jgi:hypothetical protein
MLITEWDNYKIYFNIMGKIFFPLQTFYLKNLKNDKTHTGRKESLTDVAFDYLRINMILPIKDKINKTLIMFIEKEREDEKIPSSKVVTVISVEFFSYP